MTMPISLPFGLRDIKLTAYTDAAATTLAGSSVDLPNAQTMKFSEAEDYETLRGDDQTVTMRGKGPTGTWELGSGGLPLTAVAIMSGAVATTTGVTPNRVMSLKKNTSNVRPWFKAEGQSISDSGGDMHAVLYRCRMTDSLDGEFTDGSFYITSAKGIMLGSNVSASLGALYDFVQNETAAAIP